MSDLIASSATLPAEFAEFQDYVNAGWGEAKRVDRTEKRLTSTMDEIQAFYDAVVPRLIEILEYLDEFPIDDMPDQQQCLLNLCYGIAEIRNAVESFGQPDVIDGWDTRSFKIHEPFIVS